MPVESRYRDIEYILSVHIGGSVDDGTDLHRYHFADNRTRQTHDTTTSQDGLFSSSRRIFIAMTKSYRVLLVHNDYARPSGEESAVQSIADLLLANGHDVCWFRKSSAELLASKTKKLQAFFSGIYSPQSRREIGAFLDETPVDVVQVQNLYPLLSPSILQPIRERGIPIVMRCPNYRLFCPSGLHLNKGKVCEKCLGGREYWCTLNNCEGSIVKSFGYSLRGAAARWSGSIVDNVNIFIVLSEFQKARFVAGGIDPDKLAILPNVAADTPESTSTIESKWEAGETVSFVGRVVLGKGIGHFLEAAKRLPHLPFAVAGDTSSYPGIENNAPANVRFHGFLRGEELDEFYRRSRVLAFPSQWFEGFPNVILKGMQFAKPVITSRIGGLPEIVIENETGLLHDPTDVDKLTSCIESLYQDPELCRRLGQAGFDRANREYSSEVCHERLMNIYERATAMVRNHAASQSAV